MDPHAYFDRFVRGYQVGDIEYLLERLETRCGILLAPVLFGIDAMGGSLCGFSGGPATHSGNRSCYVMTAHMRLAHPEANFVYKSLRCGLLHQGTAKYGLRFFCSYDCQVPEERDVLFRRPGDDLLFLDCVALASRFVAAAKRVWIEQRQAIVHVPPVDPSGHDLAKTVTATDISRLREQLSQADRLTTHPVRRQSPALWTFRRLRLQLQSDGRKGLRYAYDGVHYGRIRPLPLLDSSGRSRNHATLTGLTPWEARRLLTPVVSNPAKEKGG